MGQPAMNGKVCLITGANSGIGKATALGLARMGATAVLICRDRERGEAAQREIKAASGNESVDLLLADLSLQESIRQLAGEIHERYPRLHVLINNAGILPIARRLTGEGIESTLAVNHLAPFLLTNLLLDRFKASAPARIINVSSIAAGSIDFDNLQGEQHFNVTRTYGQTKMMNVLFTYELARRLEGTGVTVNCLHPGIAATNVARDFFPPFRLFTKLPFISPEKAAQTSIYLASSPEVEGISGKYFAKKREVKSPPVSYDEAAAKRLWSISEELTHLAEVTSNCRNP